MTRQAIQNPTRLVAATTDHPDLGRGLWPDLRARGELATHGGDARHLDWFGSSSSLAAAYGIAVSATMLATTFLLSIAMREIWSWPLPAVIVIAIGFATVDIGVLCANMMKVAQGGWVPLLLGALICCVMLVWGKGN